MMGSDGWCGKLSNDPLSHRIIVRSMGNTTSEHADNFEKHRRLGEVHIHTESDDLGNIQELMTVKQVVNSEREFSAWRK